MLITFSITEDPRWTREGNDLHMKAPLDLYTAMLGGELTVRRLGFGAVRFFPSMFRTDSPFTIPWEDAAIP